jgi:hypothetical protein
MMALKNAPKHNWFIHFTVLNIDYTEQKAYLEMHIFTRKVHRSSIAEKAMIDF